ncbi:precorrin-2 dehydrogenase/sirohydrochlorin ferrochelatase family protein [Pedobacter sp.]|uniref:precorrin-2 dehydrogenase/sirohydrochlorin ferrochelatase family protein n=1 Tax=Pedobacter sp. TaxID=1411316 RepID=UPI003D7F8F73
MEGNELFPVFIKLHTLHTLVVGGGLVGLEKINTLLTNSPSARLTIVALQVDPEIRAMAETYSNVVIYERAFCEEDLTEVELVVAATNNQELNQQIRVAAKKRRLLVNFADKPDLCDFYLGSVVKKGDLKIAISTNGKSPTIAKRLKEILNESLPQELDTTLQQMAALRNRLEGNFTDKVKKLNQVTSLLVEEQPDFAKHDHKKWLIANILILSLAIALAVIIFKS